MPFDKQFSWKQAGKWWFSGKFCWHFFLFSEVEIIRGLNTGKFCIFKNIVLSKNDLGRELCSLFFSFFLFSMQTYNFNQPPISGQKWNLLKFSVNLLHWYELNPSFLPNRCKFCLQISCIFYLNHFYLLVFLFSFNYIFYFYPIWYPKSCLRGLAVLR